MNLYKTVRLLLILLFFSLQAAGKLYFVRNSGTGDGSSDAAAMSFAKLNSLKLTLGDTVLLKRGEVFFGELAVSTGIFYGAYGEGSSPVISGLKQVSGWRRHTGNIFVAALQAPAALSLVLLNGKVSGMGRFPNSGYLPYTGHTTNTAIAGTAIDALPFNAKGAEVVIRKERWILDRHRITAHTTGNLQFGGGSPDGGYNNRPAVDKNGFFIQDHLQTLDEEGEWWYDKAGKQLYMVLATGDQHVQVSVVGKLVNIGQKEKISFANIDFEGSSVHGISMDGSKDISFTGAGFDTTSKAEFMASEPMD
jgi:hypothetical protein